MKLPGSSTKTSIRVVVNPTSLGPAAVVSHTPTTRYRRSQTPGRARRRAAGSPALAGSAVRRHDYHRVVGYTERNRGASAGLSATFCRWSGMGDSASRKRLLLRRPGRCAVCGNALAVGDEAYWDRISRTVRCLSCDPGRPVVVEAHPG